MATTTTTTTRVALVTGGSAGGIGHATAVAFAKLGYKVAITGRDKVRLEQALLDCQLADPAGFTQANENFLAFEVDFENERQTDELIPLVVAKFGQLDILINNAGFSGKRKSLLDEGFFEDYQSIMRVNLLAPTRLAQLAAPHLLKSNAGVIINVSSLSDRVPIRNGSYSVSKAGLSMLTRTLANSFEGTNVRVLTVSPGPIATNFVPGYKGDGAGRFSTLARRSGTPEEVANVIVFLASQQASYMTGTTVEVDGGAFCKSGLMLSDACRQGRDSEQS